MQNSSIQDAGASETEEAFSQVHQGSPHKLCNVFIFFTTSPPLHHHQASLPDHCRALSPPYGSSCWSDLSILSLPEALILLYRLYWTAGLLSFSLLKIYFGHSHNKNSSGQPCCWLLMLGSAPRTALCLNPPCPAAACWGYGSAHRGQMGQEVVLRPNCIFR